MIKTNLKQLVERDRRQVGRAGSDQPDGVRGCLVPQPDGSVLAGGGRGGAGGMRHAQALRWQEEEHELVGGVHHRVRVSQVVVCDVIMISLR